MFPHRIPIFKIYPACVGEEIIALRGFQYDLMQRQLALRDCDGELSALLSHLEDSCSAVLNKYNGRPPSQAAGTQGSRPKEALKFYVVNCDAQHIVTENDVTAFSLLKDESYKFPRVSNRVTDSALCFETPPGSAGLL
jgi:hypothetical protein